MIYIQRSSDMVALCPGAAETKHRCLDHRDQEVRGREPAASAGSADAARSFLLHVSRAPGSRSGALGKELLPESTNATLRRHPELLVRASRGLDLGRPGGEPLAACVAIAS